MNINGQLIREYLPEKYRNIEIFTYDSTASTNLCAIEYAKRDCRKTPAIFIANEQTAGRGRLGRSFISEKDSGIYMSILTYPSEYAADAVQITSYSAVIIREVIDELFPLSPTIKWVNDIYIGKKKVSGILTQGELDENGGLRYSVMGVGINVFGKKLAPEIDEIATTIEREIDETPPDYTREFIAAKIIKNFFDRLAFVGSPEIAAEYRKASNLIGKDITVKKVGAEYPARVLGITDACELILSLSDGSREILATGEVSVREAK